MAESGSSENTTLSTVTVPPPPDWSSEVQSSPSRRSRRSKWEWIGWGALGLIVVAVAAASLIRLPYYRIAPGSVYATVERIDVGDRMIEPAGDIGFVTVSQTPDISVWEWLDANFDDSVEILHEDEVIGDQTADEKREQDQRRMQLSKDAAVVVALERLGYELIVTPLGVEVASVFDCSAATDGVLGTGDLIIGVDGVEVRASEALIAELAFSGIGDSVELLVERIDPANSAATLRTDLVSVTLGSADAECLPEEVRADGPRPFIGIGTNTIVDEQLPFEVDINSGRVGGPSAGLAFTLALMDVLSEGELTNGLQIVATGTIGRDGTVGPVGGIHQKTVAAERSGADLFIVPLCCDNWVDGETGEPLEQPSNYEEALLYAKDMKVVGVATLDEALAAIGALGGDVQDFFSTEPNQAALEPPATAEDAEDQEPESEPESGADEPVEADVDSVDKPRRGERQPG